MRTIKTGMDFRCVREGINLSRDEAANLCGVEIERVGDWESGELGVPLYAQERVQQLAEMVEALVSRCMTMLLDQGPLSRDEAILHTTYDNDCTYYRFNADMTAEQLHFASVHRYYSHRVKFTVESSGGNCCVLLLNQESYAQFREERPGDSEDLRAWAAWEFERTRDILSTEPVEKPVEHRIAH